MSGDACDDDDDNDGVLDENDAFPFDPNESVDTDGDGQTDADETAGGSDPLDETSKSPDADGDKSPDCVDTDDDNIPDVCDIDSNPGAVDFDRDGIVDNSECDTQIGPPVDKDQCKDGGFARFNAPTFKNQGDCIQFVNTGK